MRRITYGVAASLDGYIAGPHGEYDWIPMDPDMDFAGLMGRFDTFLMGRRTWEAAASAGGSGGMRVIVFSRTLRPEDHPGLTIVSDDAGGACRRLREEPGKDIALFGGGELFRSLLELGQVDTVEVAVIPVLLGGGVPLLPAPASRHFLELTGHRAYPKTGTVHLEYAVRPEAKGQAKRARAPRAARGS